MSMTIEGRLKWFSTVKGYGFVVSPAVEGDIYVHAETMKRDGWLRLPYGCAMRVVAAQNKNGSWRVDRVLAVQIVE